MEEGKLKEVPRKKKGSLPADQKTGSDGRAVRAGLKFLGFGIFFLVLLGVGGFLFFPYEINQVVKNLFPSEETVISEETLKIGFATPLTSFEPTNYETANRAYLINIYEGLVRFDRNLNIESSLALSWGLFEDDLTFEFKLRPGVKFHDGSDFGSDDVKASIERALNNKSSQLQSLVNEIEEIEIMDDLTLRIKTTEPDPVLLNKLTAIFIVPSEITDFEKEPIGTGPYQFKKFEENDLFLEAFQNYWGNSPFFPEVILSAIPEKFERGEALSRGEIDLLVNVPPVLTSVLKENNLLIKSQPSLEVNFLMFNFENEIFKEQKIREAVSLAFDSLDLLKLAGGYIKPASQFVSRGIFGFNAKLPERKYDLERAKELVQEAGSFFRLETTLDLPSELQVFGEYVKSQLEKIGIDVELVYYENEELIERIKQGQSPFYFMGWRSELGDAGDFFQTVVHSREEKYGNYNGGNYSNPEVDQLIFESERTLNSSERFFLLQKIMEKIIGEDLIGVPLFESEVIYGMRSDLDFKPRIDGYILAAEIGLK